MLRFGYKFTWRSHRELCELRQTEMERQTGTCRQTVNLTDCCTMGTAGSCLTYCCGIWNHLSRSTCTSQHLAKPRICPTSRFSFSLSLSLSLSLPQLKSCNIHNFECLHPAQDKHLTWETHVNDSKDNTARHSDVEKKNDKWAARQGLLSYLVASVWHNCWWGTAHVPQANWANQCWT